MGAGVMAKPDGYTVTMTTVEVVLLPVPSWPRSSHRISKGIIRVNFDPRVLDRTDEQSCEYGSKKFIENAKAATRATVSTSVHSRRTIG